MVNGAQDPADSRRVSADPDLGLCFPGGLDKMTAEIPQIVQLLTTHVTDESAGLEALGKQNHGGVPKVKNQVDITFGAQGQKIRASGKHCFLAGLESRVQRNFGRQRRIGIATELILKSGAAVGVLLLEIHAEYLNRLILFLY
jgi:hypothetical protein